MRVRRARIMLLVTGVLVAIACPAAPAGAIVVPASANHARLGFFPSIGSAKAHQTACSTSCSLLSYHGGAVQHAEKLYSIFWSPAGWYTPGSYKTGLSGWVSDFAAANYGPTTDFSVAQQYYDRSGPGATKRFVPYALSNGGYVTATDPFPASGCSDTPPGGSALKVCLNDAQLRAEIQKVVVANKWRQDGNTEYLLFTPNGVGSCFTSGSSSCAYSGYCAYHSSLITGPGSEIVYANMPWAYTMPGCDAQMTMHLGYSNGSAIDPEVGVLSHEIIETMTDVNGKAWFDSSGGEIGDKCAYNYDGVHYGAPSGLPNNGLGIWNQIAGGNEYLMQTEFSNHNSNGSSTGCVGKNTDTAHQPIVTISIAPSPPVHGSSALFKANVTHSNAVSTVQWSFGDGSTSSVNQVSHTYATAGTKVLNVIVTDMSGNQKSVTESITVH